MKNRTPRPVAALLRATLVLCCGLAPFLAGCSGGGDPSPLPGGFQTGVVTGQVVGPRWVEDDAPVHPVEAAAIHHDDGDAFVIRAESEATGEFTLSVPPGVHTLRFRKEGFEDLDLPVTVQAGRTTVATTPGDQFVRLDGAPMSPVKWTVMYYIDDNNNGLHGNFAWNGVGEGFYGLDTQTGGPGLKDRLQDDQVNVVVFNSPNRLPPDSTEKPSPPDLDYPSVTLIRKGSISDHHRWEGEHQKASDVRTLKEFVYKTFEKYPAEHYVLLLSDHGDGLRGICFEDGYTSYIRTWELGDALREVTATGDGVHAPHPLDIVVLEACLMGMFEVAYEFKGTKVDYLLAFETYGDPHGFPEHGDYFAGAGISGFFDPAKWPFPFQREESDGLYHVRWMTHLNEVQQGQARTPRDTAKLLCYEEFSQMRQVPAGGNADRCAVAVDLNRFFEQEGVADRYVQLARELARQAINIRPFRAGMQHVNGGTGGDAYVNDYYDLKDFCRVLASQNPGGAGCYAMASQLADRLEPEYLLASDRTTTVHNGGERAVMVLGRYHDPTQRPGGLRLGGLSTLLTHPQDFPLYKDLLIYRDCPEWMDFLNLNR